MSIPSSYKKTSPNWWIIKIWRYNLFKNPYTKIEFLAIDLDVTKRTAQNYLDTIAEIGLLSKLKVGKSNYYINENLIKVLQREKV